MNTQPNTQQPTAPKRHTCRHIFYDGHRCGSPALRGDRTFCFYHRSTPRPDPPLPSTDPEVKFAGPFFAELLLPLPEDRAAIQTGIGMVMRAIGTAKIDIRRANGLLAALKLASQNLPPHPRGCPIHGNATSGRTSSTSQSATSNPQPPTPVVDEVEDSHLGPLAPILEYGLPEPEEECEPSLASIINTYLNSPPPPPPVELDKRPYDFETLQLLRRTLATTTNPETAARIRKALEEEALIPGHNLHIQACAEESAHTSYLTPHTRKAKNCCRLLHVSHLRPGSAATKPPAPRMHSVLRSKSTRLQHMFSRTYKKSVRPKHPETQLLQARSLRPFKLSAREPDCTLNHAPTAIYPEPTTHNPKPTPNPLTRPQHVEHRLKTAIEDPPMAGIRRHSCLFQVRRTFHHVF